MQRRLLPHLIALGIFIVIGSVFFLPHIQGKKMFQNDILQHKSSSNEAKKFKEETGETALWTNSMFGGMPTYQINLSRSSNLIYYVHKIFGKGLFGYPLGMILIAMLSFYILARVLELEFWTSIISSIAFALTTNNVVLIEAGHNTKVIAVYLLGITTAGIIQAFKGKWIEGSILFAFGLGYNLFINHPQMTYYYGLTLLILGPILIYKYVKAGNIQDFIKPAGGLIVAALLALGANASGLWTTMEYSKSSMRGAPVLKSANAETSSSAVEGLDWQYSMNWSNGPMDVVATFIPGVVGGGSGETISSGAASAKYFRGKAPLYWGALPITSGPAYMGCILVFLFLLGVLIKDTRYKWWILGSVILTLLLSMGKNLEWFNRIFFDYFPVYNKFRAPSSITSVTSFFIPLIGAIVLSDIVQGKIAKEELLKKGKIALGIAGVFCLFFAFMGGSFFDFVGARDANYPADVQAAIIADRKSLMSSDALRCLGLILAVAGAIWAYTKDMINQKVLLGIVGVLVIFDMWSVDRRYVNDENWSQPSQFEQNFAMRTVDQQILQDPDPHYRVMDRSVPFAQTATPAMHHKILGGYHGAKLQRANDLNMNHIMSGNQQVINMLNTKYIIGGQPGQEQVSRNPGAYGNAWFVDNIRMVNSAEEEIGALQNVTPNDAFVHQEFSNYIGGLNPTKNGTIQLTSYSPNTLVYSSNTNSEQLAVFSEMWYEPGWNVTIDGNPVDHIRANYALRALKVPAGQHEIVFDFHPSSYYTGGVISLASSSLIFIGMGWLFYSGYRRMEEEEDLIVESSPVKEKVKATVAKKKKVKRKKK